MVRISRIGCTSLTKSNNYVDYIWVAVFTPVFLGTYGFYFGFYLNSSVCIFIFTYWAFYTRASFKKKCKFASIFGFGVAFMSYGAIFFLFLLKFANCFYMFSFFIRYFYISMYAYISCYAYLLLTLYWQSFEFLIFDNSFIFFLCCFRLRLSIFRFHLDNLRWCIKTSSFSKLDLTINPWEYLHNSIFIRQINFLNHTSPIFNFKQLKLINNLLNIKTYNISLIILWSLS